MSDPKSAPIPLPGPSAAGRSDEELEVMFRAAVDTVGLGVWIHELDTGLIRSTPRMRELAGFPPHEEVPGVEAWGARIHPDDISGLTEQYGRLMAKGFRRGEVSYNNNYRNCLPDGRLVHVQWFGRMLFDDEGQPLRVIGTAIDTTEQRQTLDALRASEENYRRLVEVSPDAILVHEGGLIVLANASAVRLFGAASAQELVGTSIYDRIAPEHRERARARVAVIEQQGVPSPLALQRWLRLGGAPLDLEVTGALVSRGERSAVQVVLRDVAERRRAEILLREREQFFRALIEHSVDLVLLADGQSAITYASPAAQGVLGLSPDALVGSPVAGLVVPDDRAEFESVLAEAHAAPGSVRRLELRLSAPAGRSGPGLRVVEVSVSNRAADPAVRALVLNLRDVSDRRALEEKLRQAQKMEAVGRLAGGVAHDFNNLLSVILGCSALVLEQLDESDPMHEDMRMVSESATRAASLTRQLLAYSRKQVLRPNLLDLNEVLAGLAPMLRRLLREGVSLKLELWPEGTPVRADPGQLEQVVVNLVVNGRDAMPGGGALCLSTRVEALDPAAAAARGVQPGPHCVLSVRDTGHGMSAETQAHLFEPFFTTKAAGAGTGLGLATVSGIVEQSGGAIEVQSAVGQGTTFSVWLPAAERSAPALPAAGKASAGIAGTESLLLVEESEPLRLLLRRRLTALGYRVHAAASDVEALEWLRESPSIDGLVIDAGLPGMGGPSLIEQVRRHSPRSRLLLVSGDLEVTGAAYLPKPFTPDRLAARLRELFETGR